MNCTKCNAQIPDDSTFCPECGGKVEVVWTAPSAPAAKVFCPNCGASMAAGDSFCENCGAKVEPAAPQAAPKAPKAPGKKLNLNKKTMTIGIAAIAVILIAVIVISIIASANAVNNYALYIKDGEIFYTDMPKGEPMEITSKLVDSGSDSNYTLSEMRYYLSNRVTLSKDGKKLFFPDKASVNSYGYLNEFTLYYRDVTKKNGEATKIDSGMTSYLVNEKGSLVIYKKDGNLYEHNLKEKTKIASDVSSYRISENGKTVLYLVIEDNEEAGNLYLRKSGKDAEKVASDVTSIVYFSDNGKDFMYMKDDSLYSQSGTKDAVKVDGDVTDTFYVYEDGSFYYTKVEDAEIKCWDVISDDMQNDDGQYDELREALKETTISNPVQALCYYDGKNTTTITESYLTLHDYATEKPVIIYGALDGDLPDVKLSAYVDYAGSYYADSWSVEHLLEQEAADSLVTNLASEDKTSAIDLEDIYNIYINFDGDKAYALTEIDNEGEDPDYTVTLHEITISGSKVKKVDQLDEDVYAYSCYFAHNDAFIYFKDVKDGEGELYMNGTKVDDDVYDGSISYDENTKSLYYFVDWNEEKDLGTLKQFKGKKATSIKDDVHDFSITPEGEVLFLYDYDTDSYKGELWLLNGKKTTKLDDDVVAIIPVY